MTAIALAAVRRLLRGPPAARACRSAATWRGSTTGEAGLGATTARADRARHLPDGRHPCRTRRCPGSATRSACWPSTSRAPWPSTRSSVSRARCRSTRVASDRRLARDRVQHGRELRDEHELAGLRRRDDDEPPHPDGGAHGPELPLGRDGNGRRGRSCAWVRAPRARTRSAASGWTSRGALLYVLLPLSLLVSLACSCRRASSRRSAAQ